MQLYAVIMTIICLTLLVIIAGMSDALNDYQRFVQELRHELDEKTRKCESLKTQLKKGE